MNIEVAPLLNDISKQLKQRIAESGREDPLIIGVHTGGVWVAQHLHKGLTGDSPLGELNIAFYRDDFSRIGMHPTVEPSNLPFDVDDRHLILVDDILYTGRTIRAAMNEIFDYGRPASIMLIVLIERSGRELPIRADIVGTRLNLAASEHVKLVGPDPLRLELCEAKP
jgi:pyrimidine operon attenuation protein / uracil phosphoribosyltransferase